MLNCMKKSSKLKFHSCQTEGIKTFCCDLAVLNFSSSAGNRLTTGVKFSQSTHSYKQRPQSLDSWIENLEMFMDFIHFINQFWQLYDNSSNVVIPAEALPGLPAVHSGRCDCQDCYRRQWQLEGTVHWWQSERFPTKPTED